MGITDYFSDLLSSVSDAMPSFTTEAFAEAPKEEEDDNEQEEGGDDEAKEDGGDEEEGGDDEEEEEEEEEPVDPKPILEEKCANSSKCHSYKHHFDECVERVHKAEEDPDHKGPKEDCVEEFFHLQHCATQCAAAELFKILK